MISKILLIVSCLLVSTTVSAEIESHWVIGSFRSEYYAQREVERIHEMVGLEAQLIQATVNGLEVYRLVTEKPASASSQAQLKAALAAIGIEGVWNFYPSASDRTLIAKSGTKARNAPKVSQTAPAPPPAPARPEPVKTFKPKVVKSGPPFAPDNQSYFEFCMNKATAAQRKIYCGNEKFSERARSELSPDEQKLVQRTAP